ncbi:MAG: type IV pilus assembly protein PilE [Oceanicoccus sp.]|jgi:type IV pilus assembly protein PilE
MLTHAKIKGFSLIELTVVIAIVGILFSIALPRYQIYSLRGNRTEAFAIINEIMQAQERYAADQGAYTDDLTNLGYLASQPSKANDHKYEVTASACGAGLAECVLLTATAQGSQKNDDNDEVDGQITINSRGTKTGW